MRHSFNPQYLLKKFDQDVEVIKRTIIKTTILNSKSMKPDLMLGPLPVRPFQDHSVTLNISFSNIQLTKSNDELIIVKVQSYDPETRNSLILQEIPIGQVNHLENMTTNIPVFSLSKLIYLTFNSNLGKESIYQINYVKLDCPYPISKASQSFEYNIDFPWEEQINIEINAEKIIETKSENINRLIENINNFGYLALIFFFIPKYEENIKMLAKHSKHIKSIFNNTKTTAKSIKLIIEKIKKEHEMYQELDQKILNLKIEKERFISELNNLNHDLDETVNRNKLLLYQKFKNKLEKRKKQVKKFQQIKLDSRDEEKINFILQGYHQKLSQDLDKLNEYEGKLTLQNSFNRQTNSETLDQTLVKIRTCERMKKDNQMAVHNALIQLFYHLMEP